MIARHLHQSDSGPLLLPLVGLTTGSRAVCRSDSPAPPKPRLLKVPLGGSWRSTFFYTSAPTPGSLSVSSVFH